MLVMLSMPTWFNICLCVQIKDENDMLRHIPTLYMFARITS